jgi:hypothetical protein
MFGLIVLAAVALVATILVRRGASMGLVIMLVTGIFVPLSIAFAAWFLATPPIWTILAPRLEATVQVADVLDPTVSGETHIRTPGSLDMRVRLGRERSGRLLPLYGVQEPQQAEYADRLAYQNALRILYPIGSTITVRHAGDVTYVDEQDWFTTGVFVFCVVFALLMLAIVTVVAMARPGSRVKPPE